MTVKTMMLKVTTLWASKNYIKSSVINKIYIDFKTYLQLLT